MFHTVESNHFPGLFEAMPLYAPAGPYGHAPRQANPVLTQGHRGAQGRVSPPFKIVLSLQLPSPNTTMHYFIIISAQ